jgi:4-amino-4-deoxy-L-arabinose transferase-like glycosyltransferase
LAGGIGLLNKTTILLLPATLGAGLLLERRWSLLRSPWPWAGLAVALVVGAPNLAWQAANGFPQAEMARHIAAALGSENRAQLLPLQVILAGPLLFPVVLAGIWRLVRAPAQRPWRAFAWAYLLALALTWWQAGKSYYVAGLFPVLFAAGSIAVSAWLGRGRGRLRGAVFGSAWRLLASSGVADINGESGEQIGWPELVATVERVAATLSPEEARHAAIVTANYGEAGALELLGRGLPPVYSGHNSYWSFGRPADDVTTVILVGDIQTTGLADCPAVAAVDNGIELENEELGALVRVCREHTMPWADLWPAYRELN